MRTRSVKPKAPISQSRVASRSSYSKYGVIRGKPAGGFSISAMVPSSLTSTMQATPARVQPRGLPTLLIVVRGRGADHQHRARRVAHDLLAHRTEQNPRDRAATVRSDDDHVDMQISGDPADRATDITDLDALVDPRGRERRRGALELFARLRHLLLPQLLLLAGRVHRPFETTGIVAGHFGEHTHQGDVVGRLQERAGLARGFDRARGTVGRDQNVHVSSLYPSSAMSAPPAEAEARIASSTRISASPSA